MIRSFRPFSQNLSEKDMAKMSADLVVAATVALFFSGGTAHASVLRVAGFAHPYASIGGLGGRLREGRHCERGQCCAGSLDASTLRLRGGGGNKDIHKDNTKHTDEPVLCRCPCNRKPFEAPEAACCKPSSVLRLNICVPLSQVQEGRSPV